MSQAPATSHCIQGVSGSNTKKAGGKKGRAGKKPRKSKTMNSFLCFTKTIRAEEPERFQETDNKRQTAIITSLWNKKSFREKLRYILQAELLNLQNKNWGEGDEDEGGEDREEAAAITAPPRTVPAPAPAAATAKDPQPYLPELPVLVSPSRMLPRGGGVAEAMFAEMRYSAGYAEVGSGGSGTAVQLQPVQQNPFRRFKRRPAPIPLAVLSEMPGDTASQCRPPTTPVLLTTSLFGKPAAHSSSLPGLDKDLVALPTNLPAICFTDQELTFIFGADNEACQPSIVPALCEKESYDQETPLLVPGGWSQNAVCAKSLLPTW